MLVTSFKQIWSLSDFSVVQVTSVEKRESWEHFSASAYDLGFKKISLGSLFSTSVTWTTLQSDEDKFVLKLGSTIMETKYYDLLIMRTFHMIFKRGFDCVRIAAKFTFVSNASMNVCHMVN